MPHKSVIDVGAVWMITLIGNIVAQLIDFLEYITIIKELLGIFSILLAIGYTLYRFRKSWVGWKPKKDNN